MILLSLLFGLGSWVFCLLALLRRQLTLCIPGWVLCAWALLFPLLQEKRWVALGDTSAILDVTGGLVFGAIVLISVSTLLTAAVFLRATK